MSLMKAMTRMIEEECYCPKCEDNFMAWLPWDYTYSEYPELCPKCEKEYEKECGLIDNTD